MNRYTAYGIALALWAGASGCGTTLFGHEVEPVSNGQRVANVWAGDDDFEHVRICLEYATAMGEETKSKMDLSVAFGKGKGGSLSYESATQLARIYNVSDIMQFGHAAMYRLCEAWANGALTDAEYNQRLGRVLDSMQDLLLVQAFGTEFLNSEAIARARADYIDTQLAYEDFLHKQSEIEALKTKIAELRKNEKTADADAAEKDLKKRTAALASTPVITEDDVEAKRKAYQKRLRGMPAKPVASDPPAQE